MTENAIIADIGAGTGKITKGFLARGNKVFAVEPDEDMMRLLKNNLSRFPNCISVASTAENTDIPASSIDLIFCGNSYHWFDRDRIIPEFKRILRDGKSRLNIAITSLGTYNAPDMASPFKHGMFKEKIFEYTVYNGFMEFLHGSLSASYAPAQGDDRFEEYCESLRQTFEKHSVNGKLETRFRLSCMMGNVGSLIQ